MLQENTWNWLFGYNEINWKKFFLNWTFGSILWSVRLRNWDKLRVSVTIQWIHTITTKVLKKLSNKISGHVTFKKKRKKISQDLEMIRPVVYSNCIHSMLSILRAMFHLQIEYADPERVVRFGPLMKKWIDENLEYHRLREKTFLRKVKLLRSSNFFLLTLLTCILTFCRIILIIFEMVRSNMNRKHIMFHDRDNFFSDWRQSDFENECSVQQSSSSWISSLLQRDSQLVFATVHANKEELTDELAQVF